MKAAEIILSLMLIMIISAGSFSDVNAKVPCTVTYYNPLPTSIRQAADPGPGGVACIVQPDLANAVCITKDGKYHRQDCEKITSEYFYTT